MSLDQKNIGKGETQDGYSAVIYLSPDGRSRIIEGSCQLQWIVQKRVSHTAKKKYPWQAKGFCRTKDGLRQVLRECIREDPALGVLIDRLPERFGSPR